MWVLILIFIGFFIIFNIIPKYPYIYVVKGSNMITEGNVSEGLLLFEKGANHKNVDYMTKIRYIFTELKFGSMEKAKEKLNILIADKKLPSGMRYEAKAVYALICHKEGNIEDAKELILEVYENYKKTNMYCTIGYLFNISEEPEKALEMNLEAYEFNKEEPQILDNLGQAYFLNGEYEKSEEIYKKLIEMSPKFPEAYFNYALLLEKKGEYESAKELLEKALEKPFTNLTTITKEEIINVIERINHHE